MDYNRKIQRFNREHAVKALNRAVDSDPNDYKWPDTRAKALKDALNNAEETHADRYSGAHTQDELKELDNAIARALKAMKQENDRGEDTYW